MAAEDELAEGMSTPKKVATGAAVGLATAATVGVGKKLLGSNDDSDGDSGGSQQSRGGGTSSRSRSTRSTGSRSGTKSRPGTKSRTTSTTRSSSSGRSGGDTKTKEQLYAQAKRLKIEGRSSMTKAQLERAVARAKG